MFRLIGASVILLLAAGLLWAEVADGAAAAAEATVTVQAVEDGEEAGEAKATCRRAEAKKKACHQAAEEGCKKKTACTAEEGEDKKCCQAQEEGCKKKAACSAEK